MENKLNSEMIKYLDYAMEKQASDLHLTVGVPPTVRIDGRLLAIPEAPVATSEKIKEYISSFTPAELVEKFNQRRELDFSFGYKDMRFRVNIYYQKGCEAVSLRLIPKQVKSIKELGLPPILEKFTERNQGFVVLAGPTGSGKSTTLAALIIGINETQTKHINTIEDPIE